MSEDFAIRLRNVTKRYPRYARPADRLKAMLLRNSSTAGNPFTALKNLSLDVPRGHTVGVVGRNGSGKSTMLQIVAGTLSPTEGTAEVVGRVSALLELGSGFSPEFTGRENVYFCGRILGCTNEEIAERFDSIAAFADIGDFMDQPAKTYSSGMMLRLAFAVAISVDPDILIVDEALSVGDEAFQRKCFARIQAIQDRGGTILFVSHSGATIVELCDYAVLLDGGEMLMQGEPKAVVTAYHRLLFSRDEQYKLVRSQILSGSNGMNGTARPATEPQAKPTTIEEDFFDPSLVPQSTVHYHVTQAEIRNVRICRLDCTPVNVLVRGREYVYTFDAHFDKAASGVRFGMLIKTITGLELGGATSHTVHTAIPRVEAGSTLKVEFRFRCSLTTGVYFTNAGALSGTPEGEQYMHRIIDALMFRVRPESDVLATLTVDFGIVPRVAQAEAAPQIGSATA